MGNSPSKQKKNGSANRDERGPLLGSSSRTQNEPRGNPPTQKQLEAHAQHERIRAGIGAAIVAIFILAVVLVSYFVSDGLPGDPLEAALVVLGRAPIIVSEPSSVLVHSLNSFLRMDI